MLRVPLSPLVAGDVVLPDAEARYVARVHRLTAGDRFVAFDPEARTEAEVEITDASRGVRGVIGVVRAAASVATTGVVLLQAIGKGDKPELVIRDATALGVERVTFVEAKRSVVRVGDRADSRRRRWRATAVAAARQSGRGDVPRIEGPLALAEALESVAGAALKLCLSPGAATSLAEAVRPGEGAIAVLIGPEGGFDEAEIALAEARGFIPVALGGFVLRTETAAVAALGAIAALSHAGVRGDRR
jgi:16S rRNA (uracil1498-N3)-methyltransferase